MSWTSAGVQSGTDTSLAGITSVSGVTVNVSPNGHKTYQVPTTIGLLTITGALSWDSDFETLECSESTRWEVNAGASVIIGKSTTINGKVRWSKGVGLIMNRQQGTPFINTSAVNIWVKAGTSLAAGGKFIVNGCRVMSGGGIFCGNSTSPTGNFVTFELNGGAVLQNITGQTMQLVRCFCEPSGINLNNGRIDGRTFGGLPFSNAGWGTLSVSLEFGNFQCDGNGAAAPVTVPNASLADNVSSFDYAYVANGNDLTRLNKYIFQNSDVGSTLRTLGQTTTTWRIGVVEITKDVIFSVVNADGDEVENAVTYMKLLGASLDPVTGSRYFGIDNYTTPRVYIAGTASTGLTTPQNVLYAVAQGYSTVSTDNGTMPLTMDSLATRANDVTDGFIWSYDHLVGQPTAAMRGTGTLTQAWTMFADGGITLSRTAALAKLASSFTVDAATKRVTITDDSDLSEIYDALKAYKCSTVRAQIEAPVIGATIASVAGERLTIYADWNITINTGVTLSADTKYKQLALTGTGILTNNGTITVPYRDADGLRATVTNLDPEAFGITWFLRYRLQGTTTWTETSGAGNTAAILLDDGAYDVQVRASGYEWESALVLDTAVSLSLNAGLRYHVSANNTPQWEMPFSETLSNAFQYDAVAMAVAVSNETGAIIQPGFAELYRATQRIQHIPALVWTWVAPVTANATSQKILIPAGNPISMFLTDPSDASVKITCPVIYADTGESADDRVRGNPDGFSIILGSPATAESAGLQAGIVAALGGPNYDSEVHSLALIRSVIDLIKTATDSTKTTAEALPTLAEVEASTVLAKEATIDAVATAVDALPDAAAIATQVRTELTTELDRIDAAISTRSTLTAEDIPAGLTAAEVRAELATELGRIDVAVSTRSTLTAEDIPAGLTADDVWTATTRTLTESAGLTTEQAAQLTNIETLSEALPTLSEIEASTVLAKSADVDSVPTAAETAAAVLGATVESGATVVQSLRLANAVLGGKVSGGQTGTETFRDLADTKDVIVSTNDAAGNRTAVTKNLG